MMMYVLTAMKRDLYIKRLVTCHYGPPPTEWRLNNAAPGGKLINNRRYVLITETENEKHCGNSITL